MHSNTLNIFNWVVFLSCNNFYIFWIQFLYQIYYLKVFSPILWLFFLTFLSSLKHKFFHVNKFQCIYCFFACALGVLMNCSLIQGHKSIHLFLSNIFIVLSLTFRFLIHFKLILWMVWGRCPNVFFCTRIFSWPSSIC